MYEICSWKLKSNLSNLLKINKMLFMHEWYIENWFIVIFLWNFHRHKKNQLTCHPQFKLYTIFYFSETVQDFSFIHMSQLIRLCMRYTITYNTTTEKDISVQIFILSRKQKLDYTKFKTKSTYFGHVKTIKRFLCSRESYCCKKILTKICVPNIFMFYAKALE